MRFKNSRFLTYPATPQAIKAYLLDVGVPEKELDTIDIEALADSTVTVKELLPSLAQQYPAVSIYITEEPTEEEYQQQYIDFLKRILEDLETYGDELGTTNIYIAIDHIYNSELIPEEELFKIIEELHIDPTQLSKKVREAYLTWKYKLPTHKPKPEPKISEKLQFLSDLAKKEQKYFSLDIAIPQLPLQVTEEDIPQKLPIILVHGSKDLLAQLDELSKKSKKVRYWLNAFPALTNYLHDIYNYLKTNKKSYLANITEEELDALEKVFPETMHTLETIIKPALIQIREEKEAEKKIKTAREVIKKKKEEPKPQPEQPPIQPIGFLIPKPKKETLYWKGKKMGEIDLGQELVPYGEFVAEMYMKRLLKKYPKSEIEKVIEYIRETRPWLDPNTPEFWENVEASLEYKTYKLDDIFRDLGL